MYCGNDYNYATQALVWGLLHLFRPNTSVRATWNHLLSSCGPNTSDCIERSAETKFQNCIEYLRRRPLPFTRTLCDALRNGGLYPHIQEELPRRYGNQQIVAQSCSSPTNFFGAVHQLEEYLYRFDHSKITDQLDQHFIAIHLLATSSCSKWKRSPSC